MQPQPAPASPGPPASPEADAGLAIDARALVKTFGSVRALDGLNLRVPRGMLYGLIGPNGSGKTVFIRTLMGLMEPTSGDARVLGAPPGTRPRDIGYMPQEEALYPDLSVRENLQFFAGLYDVRLRGREWELLDLVRLREDRDRLVGDLSGGMRRRVSLAVTLVHEPRVLFLDEPTVGVDPLLRDEFWAYFRRQADGGAAVLITTHHMEEARRCDRIGLLWRGRLLVEDAPDGLLAEAGADSLEGAFIEFLRREGVIDFG